MVEDVDLVLGYGSDANGRGLLDLVHDLEPRHEHGLQRLQYARRNKDITIGVKAEVEGFTGVGLKTGGTILFLAVCERRAQLNDIHAIKEGWVVKPDTSHLLHSSLAALDSGFMHRPFFVKGVELVPGCAVDLDHLEDVLVTARANAHHGTSFVSDDGGCSTLGAVKPFAMRRKFRLSFRLRWGCLWALSTWASGQGSESCSKLCKIARGMLIVLPCGHLASTLHP